MAAPDTTEITFQVLVALGVLSQANNTLLNYSNLAATASQALKTGKQLAAAAVNQLVDFAVLFPGLTAANTKILYIREITGTTMNGFKVKTTSGSTSIDILADATGTGGLWLVTSNTLPQVFLDNRAAGSITYLEIGVIGS